MNDELTVLDYVKALLTPWRGAPPRIPPIEAAEDVDEDRTTLMDSEAVSQAASPIEEQLPSTPIPETATGAAVFPWRAFIAMGLAVAAQLSLEPGPGRTWVLGLGLYLFAAAWVVWANFRKEWVLPPYRAVESRADPYSIHRVYLWIGIVFVSLAFLTLGGNRFTTINVLLWFSAMVFIVLAFWLPNPQPRGSLLEKIQQMVANREWDLRISRWSIVLLIAGGLVIFFRVFRLWSVPPEMVSDHAEKLLDIWELLQGETLIFFPRNTGREGLQMYLTGAVIKLFGTGYTFSSLKVGTVFGGLITLPFIYLLGKELGNKRAGLIAFLFAGIAYWPNIISRVGLRFTLYPLFAAPTLYFLIRGLRRSNRNDFILAGLFLGLGLHGYTPFRIVPIVILVAVGLYLLHSPSKGFRKQTLLHLGLLTLVSLVVFLPLLRFWIENPSMFSFRTFSRLGSIESPLPGPGWQIFIKNLWNAVTMFGWSNGEIWPVSVPYRPALDVLSAALFYLGIVLILVRYIRRRNWLDLFLILTVPLLMLPSILSLAFPSENPTLNRTAGAIVPVFILIGLSLDGFLKGIESGFSAPFGKRLAWVVFGFFFIWSGVSNYDLVFNKYQENYSLSSWNTSEIGGAIKDFTGTIGSQDRSFVVAYPHWVDTRLVGINAGFPTRDFAIWPEELSTTLDVQGSKLFILKPDDSESLASLQNLYPQGVIQRYESQIPDKDFYKFFVLSD
ncbi:MAG: glycosyltransferase family 39 protein [Anaerolineales bacterium]